jgi:predicted nucleic acid-binding protein
VLISGTPGFHGPNVDHEHRRTRYDRMIWRDYRRAGGSRERVVADFVVGAHARVRADQLLTRDRGFYRECFGDLRVIDPSTDLRT